MNKLHLITHGDYEDYRLVALIRQTKRSPALSTMYKRFKETYCVPDYPSVDDIHTPTEYKSKWVQPYQEIRAVLRQVNLDGYEGYNIPQAFVEWLVAQDEGFEKVEFKEFFVRD